MLEQYFAQIDENNLVTWVSVVTSEFMAQNLERYPGRWIETFYNTPGHTYAGIGYKWNESTNDFEVPPTDES